MAEQVPFTPDEGLSDRTDSLEIIYLFYLPLVLMAILIPIGILALLFPSWPTFWLLALGLAFLIVHWFLFFLMVLAVQRRGGIVIVGLLLLIALWLTWVIFIVPLPSFLKPALLIGEFFLFVLAFLIGLFLLGGFLLPFPPPDRSVSRGERLRQRLKEHWHAFKILWDVLLGQNYPFWVVTDEPREEDKLEQRGKGDALAMFAWGNGIILSDCDHAVAVSNGLQFRGAQGPGLSFTGFAERPMRTLDLRPQLRAFTVQGLTRDGIQVKVLAFTPFQIDRGDQVPRLGEPFPYRKSAAFRAVHAQMMALPGTPDPSQRSWDELPQLYGTRILQDILSQYDFDDLYRYDPGEEPPRVRIAREFRERLRAELEPFGIQLIGGGISNLLPVKEQEVLKERVRNWRTEWVRRILVKQAEGQRERLWRIEQARAEAQAHLILALGEQLADLDRPGTPATPEKVLQQFLRILEEMIQQPMLRRYLPRETPEDLRRLGGNIATGEQG